MIGTLILAFLACMAIASLGLFALTRTGVIDQHMSLILFIAAVPLAGWVALSVEAAEPEPEFMPPDEQTPPIPRVDIDRLWLPGPRIMRCRRAVGYARRLIPTVQFHPPSGPLVEACSSASLSNINAFKPSYHSFACCVRHPQIGGDQWRILT